MESARRVVGDGVIVIDAENPGVKFASPERGQLAATAWASHAYAQSQRLIDVGFGRQTAARSARCLLHLPVAEGDRARTTSPSLVRVSSATRRPKKQPAGPPFVLLRGRQRPSGAATACLLSKGRDHPRDPPTG